MSSLAMSVCPSRKKLLTTVLNINLPSRLISNSSRISDRANVCFLISACVLLCYSLGSVWLKESSDFKLQVTNLGFDKRFVQVCRLWKYIFNRTDTLLLSLCFLR